MKSGNFLSVKTYYFYIGKTLTTASFMLLLSFLGLAADHIATILKQSDKTSSQEPNITTDSNHPSSNTSASKYAKLISNPGHLSVWELHLKSDLFELTSTNVSGIVIGTNAMRNCSFESSYVMGPNIFLRENKTK